MKIKIGITALFVLESYTSGLLQLPNFTENQFFVENFKGNTNHFILQKIKERKVSQPEKVVLVIDGSRRMKKNVETILSAFKKFPKNIELTVLLASDNVKKFRSY